MLDAIALPLSEVPVALCDEHGLARRVHARDGLTELQFHWWQDPALLPVRFDGRLRILPWGCKQRRGSRFPLGGWAAVEQVETGAFAGANPEPVVVPARLMHVNGI